MANRDYKYEILYYFSYFKLYIQHGEDPGSCPYNKPEYEAVYKKKKKERKQQWSTRRQSLNHRSQTCPGQKQPH